MNYPETKTAIGYSDRAAFTRDLKRPISTLTDLQYTPERPQNSKALRWNIEEYKENFGNQKRTNFTISSTNLGQAQSVLTGNQQGTKRQWDKSLMDLKKFNGAKSYKTIKFSNEFEQQYESGNNSQLKSSYDIGKKDHLKGLTMSLGYKATLADLITIPLPNIPKKDYDWSRKDPSIQRMKSSKSQKKIKYMMDQEDEPHTPPPKQQFMKNQYILECTPKSSKKISGDNIQEKYSKMKEKDQKQIYKSSKNIDFSLRPKTDPIDFARPKVQKTMSYNQALGHDSSQKLGLKRHQTSDSSKPQSWENKKRLNINDFQLGKCLGEGAFGQVFPAIHKQTKMLVALKKVPKQKVKYMLEQFINQIKIQMYLNHPNIVALYGFFDDLAHFYIVMEYMEGGNLFGMLKKKKKLTQIQAIEKLKEVCIGLKQMHESSILHRDIKPENIVITNGVSKLCDFGWAAICKDRRTTYCGTLDYVSPQIIEGQGYDDSVDIWCIGVLAYEMICGKTPFYNISRKQTMKRIINVNYDYPPEVSNRAKAFIDRILKKNPSERIGIDQVLKDKFLS